jgi:hypothetical protein
MVAAGDRADDDDLGVGCGRSKLAQDSCQPGLVGGDRCRRAGLEAGEVTGGQVSRNSLMSLPFSDRVIGLTLPRWAARNASAAASWESG